MITILVIDDDRIIRRSLSDALRIVGGYNVEVAQDGFEGLEMARSKLPDLIICDVEMPRLDGYGVVEELQKDARLAQIPFIFLTGRGDRGSMRQGMALGADDYIPKPFKVPELLEAVKSRFAKRERIEEHYARKMDSLRDNILSAVPHELRTPLTLIIGYADAMAKQANTLSQKQIKMLAETIVNSGRRLHRLVENYILYAQIELILTAPERVEKMRLYREAKPDEVVSAVVKSQMKKYGRFANLDLCAPDTLLPIPTNNLEKIVFELIDNAFKFSPSGTAVSVSTNLNSATFTLTIHDLGRGMTA